MQQRGRCPSTSPRRWPRAPSGTDLFKFTVAGSGTTGITLDAGAGFDGEFKVYNSAHLKLNPAERKWVHLGSRDMSNRASDDDQHLLDAGAEAWQQLAPEVLRSVCACPYFER